LKTILIISPFNIFPPYWGGATRIYNLTKYLAKEHKIILLCNDFKQLQERDTNCPEFDQLVSINNIKIKMVKSSRRSSQIFNSLLVKEGLTIIKNDKPDLIIAEFVWSGLHAIIMKIFKKVPYILDEHNIEFLRFQRMNRGGKISRFFLKFFEKICCNYASSIFCVSKIDRNFLISQLKIPGEKISVIPNGVNIDKFYPDKSKIDKIKKKYDLQDKPVILFFGKLDYSPNYEAVKIIHDEILPRVLRESPNAVFLIVGDNPPIEFHHNNLIFTGLVDNIEDYINLPDVVICPFTSGGGTRIKILEAMACGKTIVSTTIGAEGLIEKENKDFLLISDSWEEFSKKILSSLKLTISKSSTEYVARFSWENCISEISTRL